MNTITHAIVGFTISEVLMLNPLIVVIGAIIPDLDYLLGIPHRTITHSLLFLFVACLVVYKWRGKRASLALLLGLSSHLILDLVTTMGVPLFWPLDTFYSFGLTSSNNPVTNFSVLLGCIIFMYNKGSVHEFLFSLRQGQALKGVIFFLAFSFTLAFFYPVPGCPSSFRTISSVLRQTNDEVVRVNATICSEILYQQSSSDNLYQVFTVCDVSGNVTVWKASWVLENNLSKGDVIDLCGKFTDRFAQPEIYHVKSVIK